MIRRRQVLPDETGVVTREALIEALISGGDFLDFAGGTLSVVTMRAPTALDGEMVTVGAVIEWKSTAKAKPGPGQFEEPTAATPEPQIEPTNFDPEVITAQVEASEENPDGFDYSKLEAEDVEDEPVGAR